MKIAYGLVHTNAFRKPLFRDSKNSSKAARPYYSRGGSRILVRRGCTRLLLYFNTNKPHRSFFFFGRIPVELENRRSSQREGGRVRTPCTLPLDPPLYSFSFLPRHERPLLAGNTRAFAFILSVNIAKIESFQSIIRRLDLIYVIYCSKP